jgi:hypothetical protein
MGPTMAALYCAVGPDFLMKVIESASHRWKAHQYQLMKKKPKRPYWLKPVQQNSDLEGTVSA